MPWPPRCKGIEIVGVDVHIGSQITDLEPFETAFAQVAELVAILRADGHAIARLDLGGGLGVPMRINNVPPPDPAAYGAMVNARHARPRRAADPRAGPADRRQCRHAGQPA